MTSDGSSSIFTPRPVQSGQAPWGLLKLKLRGAISPKVRPQMAQAKCSEYRRSSSPSMRDADDAAAELQRRLDGVGETGGRGGGGGSRRPPLLLGPQHERVGGSDPLLSRRGRTVRDGPSVIRRSTTTSIVWFL